MAINFENEPIMRLNTNFSEYFTNFLENKKPDTFDKLFEVADITNRNIYINDIEENSGFAVESLIRFYNQVDSQLGIDVEDRVPIKLWIYSPGGSLNSALTICEAIKISKTPIWTINQGQACSAAALIFICGHKRFTFSTSTFLLHEGSAGIDQLDAHKFQNFADYYKTQLGSVREIILSHTNISQEEYLSHSRDDWWFDGQKAIEMNVADEIILKEFYEIL